MTQSETQEDTMARKKENRDGLLLVHKLALLDLKIEFSRLSKDDIINYKRSQRDAYRECAQHLDGLIKKLAVAPDATV